MCFGSSTSATIASVNAPSNQLHHLFYDNAAYAGSDISTACHPPSLYEESMTSTQTSMTGRDLETAPKLDGLIQSSTISIMLASTPPMLPRWSLTDPSGMTLLADCLRSNPSKACKSSKSSKSQSSVTRYCRFIDCTAFYQLDIFCCHGNYFYNAEILQILLLSDIVHLKINSRWYNKQTN